MYLQKVTFKQEYFKQLIKIRLDSYSAVELLVRKLSGKILLPQFEDPKGIINIIPGSMHIIFSSRANLIEFYAILASSLSQSVWLSTETTNILTDLNNTLNEYTRKHKLDYKEENLEVLYVAGNNCFNKLEELRSQLFGQLRVDLRNLHDIESFIKI